MRTIYKYLIENEPTSIIELPKGAEILCFQLQHEKLCIWALVDTEQPMEDREFKLIGTGSEINLPDDAKLVYIGTVQLRDGAIVLHLFELK